MKPSFVFDVAPHRLCCRELVDIVLDHPLPRDASSTSTTPNASSSSTSNPHSSSTSPDTTQEEKKQFSVEAKRVAMRGYVRFVGAASGCFTNGADGVFAIFPTMISRMFSGLGPPVSMFVGPVSMVIGNMSRTAYYTARAQYSTSTDADAAQWKQYLGDDEVKEWEDTFAADEKTQSTMKEQRPLSHAYVSGSNSIVARQLKRKQQERHRGQVAGLAAAKNKRVKVEQLEDSLKRNISVAITQVAPEFKQAGVCVVDGRTTSSRRPCDHRSCVCCLFCVCMWGAEMCLYVHLLHLWQMCWRESVLQTCLPCTRVTSERT